MPFHFVLGRTGAVLMAAERGDDPVKAARVWRIERAVAIAHQRNLAHLVGVNGIWSALAGHARRHPGEAQLLTWRTESEVQVWAADVVRPDGMVEWREHGATVDAFVEYDRGTEALRILVAKLQGYERLEEERGRTSWVLFAFTSQGRETTARAALADASVPIATATLNSSAGPHEAIWLPLTRTGERVRLSRLADVPKPSRALHRAASGSPRAWRFDRPAPEEAPSDLW